MMFSRPCLSRCEHMSGTGWRSAHRSPRTSASRSSVMPPTSVSDQRRDCGTDRTDVPEQRPRCAPHQRRVRGAVTPKEAIEQRCANMLTSEQMMDVLLNWSYTFGRCAMIGDYPTDAWIRGDWDDVVVAHLRGQLSDEEFEQAAHYAAKLQAQWRRWEQIDELLSGPGDPDSTADGDLVPGALGPERPAAVLAAQDAQRRLLATAFTADEVAAGLGITDSEVEQLRTTRQLWGISVEVGRSWRFPKAQFDVDVSGRRPIGQVRGLAQVLAALPADRHPAAVDGFLHTPQPGLFRDGNCTPLDWLRGGGAIDAAVNAALDTEWYGR